MNPVLDKEQQRIFISYRRSGNGAGFALGLYEGLRAVVGADNVFFDVSEGSIKVGQSWRETVRQAIARCNTLLIIVDDLFEQTIANVDDPLRIELECALELNVALAPVYIGGVKPPSRDRLPESLQIFPELHASRIRLETSPADMQAVIVEVTGMGSRRHEQAAPRIELKASTSRMPVTGREVFGREEEMARLTDAWASRDTNIVCLVAWGGVGKSALMNHWMRSLGKDFAGAERVYAWSFFSQGTGGKGAIRRRLCRCLAVVVRRP